MAHQRRNDVRQWWSGSSPRRWSSPGHCHGSCHCCSPHHCRRRYPVRRVIYGETWSLAAYLSFFHRLTIGVFGMWILLGAIPALAAMAGRFDWIVGAITAGLRCLCGIATLLEGPALPAARPANRRGPAARALPRARGRSLQLPEPLFLRADLDGGAVANALALPSRRGNAVLFTETRSWSGWTRTRPSQSADTSSRTSSTTTGRGCSASTWRPPRLIRRSAQQ